MTNTPTPVPQNLYVDTLTSAQPVRPFQTTPLVPSAFKYATEMKDIEGCPLKETKTDIEVAYRFAFLAVKDTQNFLPIALLNPQRSMPGGKHIAKCCEAWSLSMFTTLEALQNKLKKVSETSPFFTKRVGEYFTQIKLTPSCGVHTVPNSSGHFEFFEKASFDGRMAVISHGKIAI